jgi:exopolysaccharide biosynthesis polyprenyl glycosylphosphotransferase
MILLAFFVAYKFRVNFTYVPTTYIEPFSQYFKFVIYFLPVWVIVFILTGLYSINEKKGTLNEFGKILVATSAAMALVITWIFLSRTFFYSRLVIGITWVLAVITVTFGRFLIRFFQKFLYRYGIGVHRVIVLGHNSSTKPVIDEIKNNRNLGYKIVKIIDRDGIEKLDKIVDNNPCDEIIIADSTLPESQAEKVAEFCRLNNLGFKMTPNLFLVRSSHVDIQQLAGVPILEFKRSPLDGWGRIIKRTFDFVVTLILVIITSPLMIITAVLVKLTSRGPIFYKQERVGLSKNFTFYKFRTMKENADAEFPKLMKKYGVNFKLKKDPRVTPIGRFLRKTSLDELAQFFNVLRGDMSLIGPRPPKPEEVEKYNNWQKRRLGVKPGISGLWQVSGRSELSFDEWVRLDAYYIENWSLWLDVQIFIKTIWVVLKGRGAY